MVKQVAVALDAHVASDATIITPTELALALDGQTNVLLIAHGAVHELLDVVLHAWVHEVMDELHGAAQAY